MSTTVTPPVFDPKAFLAERNAAAAEKVAPKPVEAKQPEVKPVPAPPVESKDEAETPETQSESSHWSRSQIRTMNRLREEAAEARGRAAALELMIKANGKAMPAEEAPKELERKAYASDAEYAAAVARKAAQDETSKQAEQARWQQEVQAMLDAAAEARPEQIKLVPNWEKIAEDGEELLFDKGSSTDFLLSTSEFGPFVLEYFVDHPKDWDKFKDLQEKPVDQKIFFARIEGKVESVYNQRLKAAQAEKKAEKPESKDRQDVAQAGASQTDKSAGSARLPKPSSEVSAKGGIAPPSTPVVGSREWMALRNAAKATSRY